MRLPTRATSSIAAQLPDGIHAVIKTEPEWTGDDGFFTGLDALLLYSGRGMVQVLEVSREERTVLLERIEPGETLWSARLLHRIGPLG